MDKADRKFALIYVGSGIGNVIFATPAVQILTDLGYIVDCIADSKEVHYLALVAKLPFVRHAYTEPGPRQLYDVFLSTALRITSRPQWATYLRPGGIALASLSPGVHENLHEIKCNCAPLRKLGWGGEIPLPRVSTGSVVSGNHIVLFPDCKSGHEWAIKLWSPDRWVALSRRVRAAGLVPVVLADDAESTEWAHAGKAVDLGGLTSIRQACGLIAGARAAVGIDTGLAHIAAAVGTSLVVLWGPTSWVKNEPLGEAPVVKVGPTADCAPCQTGQSGPGQWPARMACRRPAPPCMDQSVDEVFTALEEVLE